MRKIDLFFKFKKASVFFKILILKIFLNFKLDNKKFVRSVSFRTRIFQRILIVFILFLISLSPIFPSLNPLILWGALSSQAARNIWVGTAGDSLWSNPQNWSARQVPGVDEIAIFDETGNKDVIINTDVSVAGVEINSGYKGTINVRSGKKVIVGLHSFWQKDGAFIGGSAPMEISGSLMLMGGLFVAPSGILRVRLNTVVLTENFQHNKGTVELNGVGQFFSGEVRLNNLTKNGFGDTLELAAKKKIIIEGKLQLKGSGESVEQRLVVKSSHEDEIALLEAKGDVDASYLDLMGVVNPEASEIACKKCNFGKNVIGWKELEKSSPSFADEPVNISSPVPSSASTPNSKPEGTSTNKILPTQNENILGDPIGVNINQKQETNEVVSSTPAPTSTTNLDSQIKSNVPADELSFDNTDNVVFPADKTVVFELQLDRDEQRIRLVPEDQKDNSEKDEGTKSNSNNDTETGGANSNNGFDVLPQNDPVAVGGEQLPFFDYDTIQKNLIKNNLLPQKLPNVFGADKNRGSGFNFSYKKVASSGSSSNKINKRKNIAFVQSLKSWFGSEANAGYESEDSDIMMAAEVITPTGEISKEMLPYAGIKDGKVIIEIPKPQQSFRPGRYTLKLRVAVPDFKNIEFSQDFNWGVLAINFPKSTYQPDEEVMAGMAVLDNGGHTLCDAKLNLEIVDSEGKTVKRFSTNPDEYVSAEQKNNPFYTIFQKQKDADTTGVIARSEDCRDKSFTYEPDYSAHFALDKSGEYTARLTAETAQGRRELIESFSVVTDASFVTERKTATRIYPPETYKSEILVKAKDESFAGTVIETVPIGFDVKDISNGGRLAGPEEFSGSGGTEDVIEIPETASTQPLNDFTAEVASVVANNESVEETAKQIEIPQETLAEAVPESTALPTASPVLSDIPSVAPPSVLSLPEMSPIPTLVPTLIPTPELQQEAEQTAETPPTPPAPYEVLPDKEKIRDEIAAESFEPPLPYAPYAVEKDKSVSADEERNNESREGKLLLPIGGQKIIWENVEITKGETANFSYSYKAPPVSPEFYLLGPLTVYSVEKANELKIKEKNSAEQQDGNKYNLIWQEPRVWQIASDAVITWDGGGADGTCGGTGTANNWTCGANWTGDVAPGVSDIATFSNTSTKNATINTSISVAGIDINTGYTGTITQAVGADVTVGASHFAQDAGTVTSSSTAGDTMTVNGDFLLGTGTFTAPRDTLSVAGNWSQIGGTFTHNSGTVDFNKSSGTQTVAQVDSFYNLQHSGAGTLQLTGGATWYSGSCVGAYRKAITIDHTYVDSDLTNFPVYINLDPSGSGASLGGSIQDDGDDLLFTSSDGSTKLSHEIESYSEGSGNVTARIWVKVPTVAGASNTTIYMYYGNASCSSQQDATNVWDSNFKDVWHMHNASSPATNSVSGGNSAAQSGGVTFGATGKVGLATDYAGDNDYLVATDTYDPTAYTISAWVRPTDVTSVNVITRSTSSGPTSAWSHQTRVSSASKASSYVFTGYTRACYGTTSLSSDQWYHLTSTSANAGEVDIYVNAVQEGQDSLGGSMWTDGDRYYIGSNSGDSYGWFDGIIDEVRISSIIRSDAWIKFEYRNVAESDNEISFGSQYQQGLVVHGALTQSAGTFDTNGFSVNVTGSMTVSGGEYQAKTGTTLNSGMGVSGGTFSGSSGNVDVNGNVTISGGTLTAPSGTFTVSGDWTHSSGSFTPGTNTVTFDGTGAQSITGSTAFYNLTINNSHASPSDTYDVDTSAITVSNNLTLTDGQFQPATGSSFTNVSIGANGILKPDVSATITVAGTWALSGTFTHNSGTVDFNGSGTQTVQQYQFGSNSFYNVTHSGSGTLQAAAPSWSYRKTITIDHTYVDSDLSGFPVYINIDPSGAGSGLAGSIQDDGDDILFTDENNNKIPHEIETYAEASGNVTARIWVKVPTVYGSSNTTIYMYYGNASCSSQQDAVNVWDSNFKGVWHFPDGTTLSALDSTTNNYDGTVTSATAASGMVDGSAYFNGSANISMGATDIVDGETALTVSAWINGNTVAGAWGSFVDQYTDTFLLYHWYGGLYAVVTGATGQPYGAISDSGLASSQWNHVIMTWSASSGKIYGFVNGAKQTASVSTSISSLKSSVTIPLKIGNGAFAPFTGSIDDVRISNAVRSDAWIKFEYRNISESDNELSIGAAVSQGLNISGALLQSGSGTLDANGVAITVTGTTTVSGGEYQAKTVTQTFNGGLEVSGGTFSGSSGTVDATNVTISGGTLTAPSGSFLVSGNWSKTSGTFTPGTNTVTFDSATAQTITGSTTFYNLTIANTHASPDDTNDVDADAITVSNNLALSDGQFQPATGASFTNVSIDTNGILKPDLSATTNVAGSWTRDGTFTHNGGTVVFNGGNQSINDSNTWYNFTKTDDVNNSTDETLTFEGAVKQTIASGGVFTITGIDSDDRINLRSTTDNGTVDASDWQIDIDGTPLASYYAINFADIKDANNTSGSNITVCNTLDSGGNSNWTIGGSATFEQNDWRWYADSDTEDVSDPWGVPDLAENATMTILPASRQTIKAYDEARVRVNLTLMAGSCPLGAGEKRFKLQYATSTGGSWTDVDAGAGAGIWRYATSSVSDGTAITVARLSTSEVLQSYIKTASSALNPNGVSVGQDMEYDFHIEHNGAVGATDYVFRVVESDGTPLTSYAGYPALETFPTTNQLMRHGNFFKGQVEKGNLWTE